MARVRASGAAAPHASGAAGPPGAATPRRAQVQAPGAATPRRARVLQAPGGAQPACRRGGACGRPPGRGAAGPPGGRGSSRPQAMVSLTGTRLSLSWSNSFVGSMQSVVYPSDFPVGTARMLMSEKSGKVAKGDVRRFLLSRSQSLRQLKWPEAGKHLMGCMVSGSKSPVRERWIHGEGDLPLSFSYVSASSDDSSINCQFQDDDMNTKHSTSVFESSHNVLINAPEATLGAAALALHYANLIIFIEKLAISPHHICLDERDALYSMLTDRIRASLRARLKPFAKNMSSSSVCDPILTAEWADTVQRILGWLAPLAHNMICWQSERHFEQRNVASGTSVLLLQTLHFADQKKTEAAVTELLVGLNYLWRFGRELDAKAE